ncbi:glutamate synthase subunit beta [Streptomyces sp. NPDC088354]|uniref:glutamate synthase subunit beta n=1 Tax=unclassified Streptomyces TaxID=2593676 RepID=UPI0029BBFBF3|nr:glutamate synthase subunit beta [Streptomyces sp. MI02-7b]MDX3073820.1 glutamate synthase subunit beta [Streptomyces sp. MI02-7b]
MADPKGFLTTPRRTPERRPVDERVQDWQEVYTGQGLLPIVSAQAGRCMDCGIPFCHAACPLGNMIPDWNDLVFREDWVAASDRLHATNNFPEFTGRLCPAPCESACVLTINADPVTIKNVEVAIADRAWAEGLAVPLPPECRTGRTVAVVGSGPAGLAAAQQLTRAGHTVTVYERDDRLGGLLRYGIPEFKMEKHHLDRRLHQMRAEGTRFCTGAEVGGDLDAHRVIAEHDAVLLAVGARAWRELPVPGRELAGIHQAMDYLTLANRVCEGDLTSSPISAQGKDVVIVGGGDTGADCLGTVLRQRAASVVQLDINPLPGWDRPEHEPWPVYPRVFRISPAHEEARLLGRREHWDTAEHGCVPLPGPQGDIRVFSASTFRFEGDDDGHVASLHLVGVEPSGRRPRAGTERVVPAQLVLLALGFSGPERNEGVVPQLGLGLDARGRIARDAAFATTVEKVWVAGDAGRGQSLIVWAIAEGRSAAAAVDRALRGATCLPAPITPTDQPLVV